MTKPHQKTKEYEIVSELNELYREVGSIHKKIESLMNKISHMATEKECECRNNDRIMRDGYNEDLRKKLDTMEKEYEMRKKVIAEGYSSKSSFRDRHNELNKAYQNHIKHMIREKEYYSYKV